MRVLRFFCAQFSPQEEREYGTPFVHLFAGGDVRYFPFRATCSPRIPYLLFVLLERETVLFPDGATTRQDQKMPEHAQLLTSGREVETRKGRTMQEKKRQEFRNLELASPAVPTISKTTRSSFAISPPPSVSQRDLRRNRVYEK